MVTIHLPRVEVGMTAAEIADVLTQNGMPAYVATTGMHGERALNALGHAGLLVVKGTFGEPETILFRVLPEMPTAE
jgi:hypothetical protein